MHVQDALRAQYFLSHLEKKLQEVSLPSKKPLAPFLVALCRSLDKTILPTIAHEIADAKKKGMLQGETSEERYRSFFIQDGSYTKKAQNLPKKHPFIFSFLDHFIDGAFANLKQALFRFEQDKEHLSLFFPQFKEASIYEIDMIAHSDQHQGQQTLLFTFSNGEKLIYKPRDLRPDRLLKNFINRLNLSPPFDLKTTNALTRSTYGWMEFIPHDACKKKGELNDYFKRAGVLLAIAETLNYTDGHFENLMASGSYPILLDGETLFQNFTPEGLKEKSILSTQLIQKISPDQSKKLFHSAFQSHRQELYHTLYPHPINERTDELKVEFHGNREIFLHNLPLYEGKHYLAQDYIPDMIDGLSAGYDAIRRISLEPSWWEELKEIQVRALIRNTVNYAYLLRRIQQPGLSRSKAGALIAETLGDTPFTSYEVRDLLAGNIPYFYFRPYEKDLYSGDHEKYPSYFTFTSAELVQKNLAECTSEKRDAACVLVKEALKKPEGVLQEDLMQ